MAKSKTNDEKFPIETIQANAKAVFGVEREVVVGALYGKEGEFTKTEVETLISEFLQKEVVQEGVE